MDVIKNKIRNMESVLVYGYIFIAGFIMSMQSSMGPWGLSTTAGTDSSVFKTMALLMSKGFIPYKDSFDHKGPLIYIINWLGMQISYYKGIWVIELLTIVVTLGFIYKIAHLVCGKLYSCMVLLIVAFPLYEYLEGGNLVEEYAMPFIAISLYYFIDYFLNEKINPVRLIICGLSLGAVCLLRVNMISVWVVFCIAVLIHLIYQQKVKKILVFLSYFLCGLGMMALPILIWLTVNGALYDFWENYIVFNQSYISDASFIQYVYAFLYFFGNVVMIVSVVSLVYQYKIKPDGFHLAYICYYFLTLAWICIGGRGYAHYGMILIPLMAYPISIVFMMIEKRIKDSFFLTVVLGIAVISVWNEGITWAIGSYVDRNHDSGRECDPVIDIITERTDENDTITVWGNWNIIYVLSHRIPASKYSYQFPIADIDYDIYSEYFEDLEVNQPKFIIIQPNRAMGKMEEFLKEHLEYQHLDEIEGIDIYENKGGSPIS